MINEKNEHFEFTHFFFVESGIYNYEFVRMLDKYFDCSYHRFIFASKINYEQCACFREKGIICIYDPTILKIVKGIDKYYLDSDFCFWHSKPFGIKELLRLKYCYAEKTIWCVWGHDLYDTSSNGMKMRFRELGSRALNHKVPVFKAIVAGFEADSKEIIKRYGAKVNIYNAVYPQGHSEIELDGVQEYPKEKEKIRILLGHSCYSFLKHEKYLRRLLPYKDKIELVIPLNYGDMEYGNEVEKLAKELWNDSAEIYRDFISPEHYLEILKGVDAAIFDYEHQAAYGNILLLLFFGKRCYLSSKGIMFEGLLDSGVEVYACEDIVKQLEHNEVGMGCQSYNNEWARSSLCTEVIKNQWEELFQNLLKKE